MWCVRRQRHPRPGTKNGFRVSVKLNTVRQTTYLCVEPAQGIHMHCSAPSGATQNTFHPCSSHDFFDFPHLHGWHVYRVHTSYTPPSSSLLVRGLTGNFLLPLRRPSRVFARVPAIRPCLARSLPDLHEDTLTHRLHVFVRRRDAIAPLPPFVLG